MSESLGMGKSPHAGMTSIGKALNYGKPAPVSTPNARFRGFYLRARAALLPDTKRRILLLHAARFVPMPLFMPLSPPIRALAAIVPLSLTVGACTSMEGEFPTLAKRNIETYYEQGGESRRTAFPQLPPTVSPALVSQLENLLAQANAGERDFRQALPLARSRANAARGSAVGGENWAQATTMISALNASRDRSTIALADLDQLYAEKLTAEQDNPAEADAIESVRQIVSDMVQAQTEQVDTLTALVGG